MNQERTALHGEARAEAEATARNEVAAEARRLERLRELLVLDSAPEPLFDGFARLASEICGTPIALLSLVDAERQWFKANVGLPGVAETPHDMAFCAHAIDSDALMEVPDAVRDPRFADNPLVTGAPDIRFYAGAPLVVEGGARVGTLCVIDRRPRHLDERQQRLLAGLAALAGEALDLRRTLVARALAVRSEYERALAASEAQHRALIEEQSELVALSDAERRLHYVNPAYARHFGFDPAALVGSNMLDRVHPAHRAEVDARLTAVLRNGRRVRGEIRNVAADGSVRWIDWTTSVTTDASGRRLLQSVGRDVTRRRQAEQALRASQELLRRTERLAGVGGWELDLATGAIVWSEETCRIHEVPPGHVPTLEEAVGYFPADGRRQVEEAVQRGTAQGLPWDLELPFVTARGRPRWVRALGRVECDDAGRPLRLTGALQDITERKRLEQRLAESERFVRQITDSVPVRIAYLDREARYRFVNQAHCRRFGRAREDILGRTRNEMTRGNADDAAVGLRLQAVLRGEPQRFEFEELLGSEVRCIESQMIPDVDEAGRVRGFFTTGIDITDRKRIERELVGQNELTRVTLHSIADAVVTTDGDGRVQYMNPVAEKLAGWSAAEAAGRPVERVLSFVDEATRQPVAGPLERCLAEKRSVGLASDMLLITRDGSERGIEDTAAPIHGNGGEVIGAVLVFRDVTAKRRRTQEMHWRATHDALTGLANRAEFESRLGRLFDKARHDGGCHALLAIDLDRFKAVNDACGHAAGDRLLRQVSALLRQGVRSRDTVARLGGDEFGVILEQCPPEQARRVAQQICDSVEGFVFVHDGRRFGIGASVGLVPLDARWDGGAAAMKAADAACYAAKHAGRSRVHVGGADELPARREDDWGGRLRRALDGMRFELQALRIEPLAPPAAAGMAPARRGLHCELRPCLRDDDGRLVAAAEFMPAAERLRLASQVDRWLVDAACARLAADADADADERIALLVVPLAAQSVADHALHRRLLEATLPLGPRAAALCLQIGEDAALAHPAEATDLATLGRTVGVRIALGGLGAGTSSLGLLRRLPVDFLKIDGAVVRGAADDALDRTALRCWRDAARALGAATIAAGVERPGVLAALRELGIDHAQGRWIHEAEMFDALAGAARPHAFTAG